MIKVEKIVEKIELQDVEVQNDPCKHYFDEKPPKRQRYDCMIDCYGGTSPVGSDAY